MKVYKNQTLQSATLLGLGANYKFASDKTMSPNGVDITECHNTITGKKYYEVTEYNQIEKTARISVMFTSEYSKWLETIK
jgi:hypothetical protein